MFSLGREPVVNESLAADTILFPLLVDDCDEKAANERFLVGVLREARREIVLNQDVLLVRRVVVRHGDTAVVLDGSLAVPPTITGLDSFWF